ncbi:hypothetical protein JOD82_002208 [Paenibacillus sp. 1182]|uniref:hypothetical protein n=1 Tax=Paenibacillus sp. 1182 TaxID=2806565 RepID=UPI001AEA8435|nr:hypothetical protein [Paenibacillus sp. 1182]MBP1309188.1 hypothetical protein [Paenibacillus sp. 1182]
MNYYQYVFNQYIKELHNHLFENEPIDSILRSIRKNHRKRRFMNMYVLKDKETFHYYYVRRNEMGLDGAYNQIVSALFHEEQKLLIKSKFIYEMSIKREMISSPVLIVEIKEFTKDLQSFVWYATKKVLSTPVV